MCSLIRTRNPGLGSCSRRMRVDHAVDRSLVVTGQHVGIGIAVSVVPLDGDIAVAVAVAAGECIDADAGSMSHCRAGVNNTGNAGIVVFQSAAAISRATGTMTPWDGWRLAGNAWHVAAEVLPADPGSSACDRHARYRYSSASMPITPHATRAPPPPSGFGSSA